MRWSVWSVTAAAGAMMLFVPTIRAADSATADRFGPATERRSTLAAIDSAEDLILLEKSTRSLPPVVASPDEATIARVTGRLLAQSHYTRHPLDDAVSSKFLDRYLDNLDNLRLHFLEADVQEFEKYRAKLDDLTKRGDTTPAREIFQRFLERVEQRVTYVAELLRTETFDFTGDDHYQLDRRRAPRAKTLEEARQLWRQHLRYEILQEKLSPRKPGKDPGGPRSAAAKNGEAGTLPSPHAPAPVLSANGLPEDVVRTLSRRYARLLKTLRDFDGPDVFQYYLSSLAHVYDPHSDYLGKASLENFAINMNLSLCGIGAVLLSEDGYCKVRELRPGPAMKSKQIRPGDRIVAVAQADGDAVDVVDMKLNRIVEMIRGPKGTKVGLTIIPVDATDPSERRQVTLVREEINLEDEAAKARLIECSREDGRPARFGLIELPSFYSSLDVGSRQGKPRAKSTTIDVARLLERLKQEKIEGLILDLRRNGGGSLEEAIDLTGLFIKEGVVVQVRDFNDRVIQDDDPSPDVLYDGPLLVLTSRFSASASEIVAAALQDYGRALIVGDSSTHGKGTVQSLIQLQPMLEQFLETTNNPGALKITIRKFYRATGSSTQLKGVAPDIVLPSVSNYADVGESSLDDPLLWDTIPSANFVAENRIAPYLDSLRRQSEARVARDRDYDYVREDIELYRKHQVDKSVSLNEAERRREKAENEGRLEARKLERKARPHAQEKVYEFTLKNVDLPGLPPLLGTINTNAVTDAAAAAASRSLESPTNDDEESAVEDPATSVDAALKEAKRILIDLVDLSRESSGLAKH